MSDFLKNQFLVFNVDEAYAIELSKVQEIVEMTGITRVPETPSYIAGVMNLRGHVVPVLDIRERFKKAPAAENSSRRCIVLVEFDGNPLGLIVDNVVDLITIEEGAFSEPPQVGNDYSHVFIRLVGVHDGKMHLIIDTDKLVNHSDLKFMDNEEESVIG